MELGISLASHTLSPGRGAADHLIARCRAAVAADLDSMTLGDHHAVPPPGGYLQNTPALGRLLAEWRGRPAGCLFLLPQWPPFLVAEQVGTLANLHDGRFIVQTGLGWAPHEFAAMGQPTEHRVSVFEEGVRVVQGLLAGDTVSSERFGFSETALGLVPPEPVDWWMGTTSPAGLRRAARFGAAWYASPSETAGGLVERCEIYGSACDEHDVDARVMLRRDMLVLADGDRARRLADEAVDRGYRGMSRSAIVAGSPSEVAEDLASWSTLGVDQIVARTMGLGDDLDLETIECLADVRRLIG
jgi:alkanesulfonate monooxygenase SsuD/methylene tetrahydromethanopterin reductase-like flavin-dependent oxidoreductase (luciferase family)